MRVYRVIMKDSEGNTLEIIANRIVWKAGGDDNVDVYANVLLDYVELLDKWESSQTTLEVSIEPIRCFDGFEEIQCPAEVLDLESQEGTAKMTYDYIAGPENPFAVSVIIHLTFVTEGNTTTTTSG